MQAHSFPSLYGDSHIDDLVEGDNQIRYLLEGEPVPVTAVAPLTFGKAITFAAVSRASVH
jgi:hypothetical protein